MWSWIQRRPVLVAAVLIVGLVAAVYGASLSNGTVWDDRYLVTGNPYLGSLDGLGTLLKNDLWTASGKHEPSSFYRPLTMVTFWLNAQIAGQSPASMRAGNILFHALNAVLLLLLLRRLLEPPRMLLASLLAAFWAVMAVNSEPVLWISGRFDPMTVTAALACLLSNRLSGWRRPVLVVLFAAFGLLSKEAFMGWLPLLLLDDLLLLRRSVRGIVAKYVALAVLVGMNIALRDWVGIPSLSVVSGTGLSTLVESYLYTVATLLPRAFFPFGLDPFHPYHPLPVGLAALVAVVLCVLTVGLAWRALRRGCGKPVRVAAFGWCWVLLALFPASVTGPNLFMIGDRYAYLPTVGLSIMGYGALSALLARFGRRRASRALDLMGGALALFVAGQAYALVARSPDWRDDRTLAEASLRAHPDNPYALYSLGTMALDEGELQRADSLLMRAAEGNDRSWRIPNAICVLRIRQRRLDEARVACDRTLALNPQNPRAWVNSASVEVNRKNWPVAWTAALRAIELKPQFPEARYLAAVSAANLGRIHEASEQLREGLKEDPAHAGLLNLQRQLEERP